MKTQLTSTELNALTPSQRAKYRKITKAYNATLDPVRTAKIKLEEELRRAAYVDLNIDERMKEVETPIRQEMEEIEKCRAELFEQWKALADRITNETQEIAVEPYRAAYNNPQVQALSAIWQTINETHAKALEEFRKVGE
jgi:hypothetical protein